VTENVKQGFYEFMSMQALTFKDPITLVGGAYVSTENFKASTQFASNVVAADGGANTCLQYGVKPTAVIGDLDSIEEKSKVQIESFPVKHGKINSILYKINNSCAYVSDVSKISEKDYSRLKKLNYFIVDCLRYDPHPSHFNLDQVLNLVKIIKPKKTILTNMNNEIDYVKIQKHLPKSVVPAYDGMSFLI